MKTNSIMFFLCAGLYSSAMLNDLRAVDQTENQRVCTRRMAEILASGYRAYGAGYLLVSDGYTSIESSAFAFENGFRDLGLHDIITIRSGAFSHCRDLQVISEWRNVKTIEDRAFLNTGLTEIVLPNGIRRIGNRAFANCANLTRVEIPNSITSIGEDVFEGCSSNCRFIVHSREMKEMLKAFKALPKHSIIDVVSNVLDRTQPLIPNFRRQLIVPNYVRKIDDYMFKGRKDIDSIVLPAGVTHIGEYAFDAFAMKTKNMFDRYSDHYNKRCLKTITIPDSVVSIKDGAFKPSFIFGKCGGGINLWATVNVMFNNRETIDEAGKNRMSSLLRDSGFKGIINFVNQNMDIIDRCKGIDTIKIDSDIKRLPRELNINAIQTVDVYCGYNANEVADEVRTRITNLLRASGFVGTLRFVTNDVIREIGNMRELREREILSINIE